MRLLKCNDRNVFGLTKEFHDNYPDYAILSHTWGADDEEVTFDDIQSGFGLHKQGWSKIKFCGERVKHDRLSYFWVDTCCIDKTKYHELPEAIYLMFRWYQLAAKCYVYLEDVSVLNEDEQRRTTSWKPAFCESRWFTRGWTLQELIAPKTVDFFSREGTWLGDKTTLEQEIHSATSIPISALRGTPLAQFSISERLRWAKERQTTRIEDKAYCLMGIFDVSMDVRYGERDKAFSRLQSEITKTSSSRTGYLGIRAFFFYAVFALGISLVFSQNNQWMRELWNASSHLDNTENPYDSSIPKTAEFAIPFDTGRSTPAVHDKVLLYNPSRIVEERSPEVPSQSQRGAETEVNTPDGALHKHRKPKDASEPPQIAAPGSKASDLAWFLLSIVESVLAVCSFVLWMLVLILFRRKEALDPWVGSAWAIPSCYFVLHFVRLGIGHVFPTSLGTSELLLDTLAIWISRVSPILACGLVRIQDESEKPHFPKLDQPALFYVGLKDFLWNTLVWRYAARETWRNGLFPSSNVAFIGLLASIIMQITTINIAKSSTSLSPPTLVSFTLRTWNHVGQLIMSLSLFYSTAEISQSNNWAFSSIASAVTVLSACWIDQMD